MCIRDRVLRANRHFFVRHPTQPTSVGFYLIWTCESHHATVVALEVARNHAFDAIQLRATAQSIDGHARARKPAGLVGSVSVRRIMREAGRAVIVIADVDIACSSTTHTAAVVVVAVVVVVVVVAALYALMSSAAMIMSSTPPCEQRPRCESTQHHEQRRSPA